MKIRTWYSNFTITGERVYMMWACDGITIDPVKISKILGLSCQAPETDRWTLKQKYFYEARRPIAVAKCHDCIACSDADTYRAYMYEVLCDRERRPRLGF